MNGNNMTLADVYGPSAVAIQGGAGPTAVVKASGPVALDHAPLMVWVGFVALLILARFAWELSE